MTSKPRLENADKTLVKQSDERLERYLAALEASDKEEQDAPGGGHADDLAEKIGAIRHRRDRLESHLEELERSGEDQLSLTDPAARAMAPMTKVGVGYNIQITVDEKHKLIAEQEVYNRVLASGLLTETAKAAKDVLGADAISVVADRGYFQIEDIEACEAAGITPFVPKPAKGSAKQNGLFAKEDFTYDTDTDGYHSPGGQFLPLIPTQLAFDLFHPTPPPNHPIWSVTLGWLGGGVGWVSF